jgi:hypothetical protein
MTRLENWRCVYRGDVYTPPELQAVCLVGQVYGHRNSHRHPDGKEVCTSYIVKAERRVVTTASGSVYHLGKIDPEYRKYLAKERPDWDYRNPITLKKEE